MLDYFNISQNEIGWLVLSKIETGIENATRMEVSSINKVAIACSTGTNLSIWDMKTQVLEFEKLFDSPISDLDWTGTPDMQGMLAIGLSTSVHIYSQLRFDYTSKTSAWTQVKVIDISNYTTHAIGDSIWLYGGAMAVGAGNQFFIADGSADIKDSNLKILVGSNEARDKTALQVDTGLFEVCAILNGPLPVYHPQLLIQSLFANKLVMVKIYLLCFLRKSSLLLFLITMLLIYLAHWIWFPKTLRLLDEQSESRSHLSFLQRSSIEYSSEDFGKDTATQLQEWLQKVSLPYLTQHQQVTLVTVIEGVSKFKILIIPWTPMLLNIY